MKNGYVISIEESFDNTRQCFHAIVSLQEQRQDSQYGDTVTWDHSGDQAQDHRRFMNELRKIIEDDVLPLLTYKSK